MRFPSPGRGTIGSLCLSLHSFMPRFKGEVKGAELLGCVCVCVAEVAYVRIGAILKRSVISE